MFYTVPSSTINWYTSAVGGSVVGTGSPFNPVPSVIANTNTPGTFTFYAECSSTPGCRSTVANFIIEAAPSVFNVTGGGAYCAGGSGVAVGLSGSQSGVNYQLQVGAVNTGAPVAGTGSAISFGNQTAAGNYTVIATSTSGSGCQANMNGTVTVTINPVAPSQGHSLRQILRSARVRTMYAYTVPNDPSVTLHMELQRNRCNYSRPQEFCIGQLFSNRYIWYSLCNSYKCLWSKPCQDARNNCQSSSRRPGDYYRACCRLSGPGWLCFHGTCYSKCN